MKSKWFTIKPRALNLRQQGYSLRRVEKMLKIPKSTLSGWFRDIKLSKKQLLKLEKNHINALIKGRKLAVIWHNQQKEIRLKLAEKEAIEVFSKLNINDISILELALAILYLGEGFKTNGTGIGNSDPMILNFFISALVKIYKFSTSQIKCELHLRADQNPNKVRKYWSKKLNLPLSAFTSISIDKRTEGFTTYPHYNGVCVLRCGNIAILRRLTYLSKLFCEEVSRKRTVSSVGRASA